MIEEGGQAARRHTYAQPALFAVEVALSRLPEATGMRPAALIGHSVGELAAAHLSGILDLDGACTLVAARGRLMGELPAGGGMVAIEATELEVEEALAGAEGVEIAAVNGPGAVVISGPEAPVLALRERFAAAGHRTRRLAVSHAFHSPLIDPMLDDFAALAAGLDFAAPRIPIVSTLTGRLLTDEEAVDPAYWVHQARGCVRFADAIATAADLDHRVFVELGPQPVLCPTAAATLEARGGPHGAPIATLRGGRPEAETLLAAIAAAHAQGAAVDWEATFAGSGARRVPLPTYPFQRERYWLEPTAGRGDVTAAGLADPGHPFLGAAVELPDDEGWALTGRISLAEHPWLADHAVLGTPILPGTALVELALRGGEEAGLDAVEELILQAPLVLAENAAVAIQVRVGAAAEEGSRPVTIASRPAAEEGEWTTHATGTLAAAGKPAALLAAWPPEGADPVPVESLYDRLAEAGLEYGPAFAGLQRAWRRGGEVFAEVSLAVDGRARAGGFAVDPALLDAALHAGTLAVLGDGEGAELRLPFAWSRVQVEAAAAGAAAMRVTITEPAAGEISLLAYDESGAALARIASLAARSVDPAQLRAAAAGTGGSPLLGLDWVERPPASPNGDAPTLAVLGGLAPELEAERHADLAALLGALGEEEEPARLILAPVGRVEGDPPAAAHRVAAAALGLVQEFLAIEPLASSRLLLVSRGAVAAADGEAPDPAAAAAWGLVRSAQSEHPGRLALIDTDDEPASLDMLPVALALAAEEPQLALRAGRALAPRLGRPTPAEEEAAPLDPDRTVLITGGTGALGAILARHLVEAHGARRLLLASRSGLGPAAAELAAELRGLGAEVEVAACDVGVRDRVAELLAGIDPDHPLGAVIHAAGLLDDGVINALDPARIERVMAPKADAAWHLHELTAGLDLSHFVLFSSIAGTLGGPGQGNYAAANAFLDALAQARRAAGLAGTSIAWGAWIQAGGLTGGLSDADLARMRRSGIENLADEEGLRLFDAALAGGPPFALAAALDRPALRSLAAAGALAPILSGLVRAGASRRADSAGALAARLAAVPAEERERLVLETVSAEVAAVLGHTAGAIDPERAFQEMGFDSLAAVELRNRLSAATGRALPATLVFDYPSAQALADRLLAEMTEGDGGAQAAVRGQATEAEMRSMFASISFDSLERAGVMPALLRLLAEQGSERLEDPLGGDEIEAMDADELVSLIESRSEADDA